MGSMSNVDVKHLAELARLELTDDEVSQYEKEITSILGYIEQINTIAGDVDGPIESAGVRNVFREDENPEETGRYTEDVLAAAPQTQDGYVKVQKILDTGRGDA